MEVFLEDENNVIFTQIPSKTSVSEPTHTSAIWRSSEELDHLIQCRHLQQIVDSRQSDIKLCRFHDNEIWEWYTPLLEVSQAWIAWSFRQTWPTTSERAFKTHRGHRLNISAHIKVGRKNKLYMEGTECSHPVTLSLDHWGLCAGPSSTARLGRHLTESEQAPELYPLTKISLISKRTHGPRIRY